MRKNNYGLAAGLCLLAAFLMPYLFIALFALLEGSLGFFLSSVWESGFVTFALILLLAALSILLMINLRSFAAAIPAGLYGITILVNNLIQGEGMSVLRVLFFLHAFGWILLAVVLLAADPKLENLKESVKGAWIFPVILIGSYELGLIISNVINMFMWSPEFLDLLYVFFVSFVPGVLFVLGALLAARWAVADTKAKPKPAGFAPNQAYPQPQSYPQPQAYPQPQSYPQPQQYQTYRPIPGYAPTPPAAQPAAQAQEVAEALRSYKALLDEGILSQEEFEAKKRQLLG